MKRINANSSFAACMSLIFFLIAGIIGGCSGGGSVSQTTARGWVSATEPISGANLTFYNIQGDQVDETKKTFTGKFGSFIVKVKNLPRDFRVVASGGSHQRRTSTAVFSADFRNYDPEIGIIHINAVTTMVSAYIDRHPSKTLDEATRTVKSFLEIPDWFDIGSHLTPYNEFFSHSKFMSDALAGGGVNNYIAQLIDEIDSSDIEITHPFPPEVPPPPQGAGSAIGMALASGAASYVGGEAMGWGLKETGLWDPDKDTENMQRTVLDISQQLTQLDYKLTQIYNELSQEIKESTYGIRVHQLDTVISNIISIRNRHTIFISNPPAGTDLERERQDIIDMIGDRLIGNEYIIPLQLREQVGAKSLIRLFNEIVKGQYRFAKSEAVNDYLKTQADYFNNLQDWMLLLQVEYWHSKGEGMKADGTEYHPNIDSALTVYNTEKANQQALIKLPIPKNTMIDTTQKMMIATRNPSIFCYFDPLTGKNCTDKTVYYPLGAHRDDFDLQIGTLNSANFAGFKDWRKPSTAEIQSFFVGHGDCGGPKGSHYLESQGWPDIPDELFLGSADFYGWSPAEGNAWWIRTYQVHGCYESEWITVAYDIGYPLHADGWSWWADWIPVRTISDNEFNNYFY